MWIFTTTGFYSVVQKPGEMDLTVRARCAADLDHLRDRYMPQLSPTLHGGGSDYPYRAHISHPLFAAGLALMAFDITYPNFKDEIYRQHGIRREAVYTKVWALLKRFLF